MLVIAGSRDFHSVDAVREWTARGAARLVRVENAGHYAFLDRPATVFDALHEFFTAR
jgi:pimeloyl-ACP methyl ester carboxylesterase